MQPGDFLDFVPWNSRRRLPPRFPQPARAARDDVKRHVHLVLRIVALLRGRHLRLVESILLHDSFDAGECAVDFLVGVELSQLQAGRAGQLVHGGIVGNAFDGNHAHKKISHRQKAQPDAGRFRAIRFGLNIGEASGGEKSLHGVVERLARERFADLERSGCQQRGRFVRGNARQFKLVDR